MSGKEDRPQDLGISVQSAINIEDFPELVTAQQNIQNLTSYAEGLGKSFVDTGILETYSQALVSQQEAFNSIIQLTEPHREAIGRTVELVNNAFLPITGAVAEIGLANANVVRLLETGAIETAHLHATQSLTGLALDAINTQQALVGNTLEILNASGVTDSLQIVSSGVSEMMRALPTFPDDTRDFPVLEIAREETEISQEETITHQARLDALLAEINPKLVSYRVGAWEAFNGKGEDYIGQASSSMRRLVDALLRELAPEEEVEQTGFFQSSPNAKDTKGKPTRKARVLYLLNWDQNKASHLDRLTTGFLQAYDNLSAWDHVPIDKDGFVHGALTVIEGHLLSILTVNETSVGERA